MPNDRAPDGTYMTYFSFGALSLVPQIAAYHKKLVSAAKQTKQIDK